jgi:hypothetical protein
VLTIGSGQGGEVFQRLQLIKTNDVRIPVRMVLLLKGMVLLQNVQFIMDVSARE